MKLRRLIGTAAMPALMVLSFFTGTLVGDTPTQSPKPVVESPNLCGTEGDTCPMPPIGQMPWACLPSGHEG